MAIPSARSLLSLAGRNGPAMLMGGALIGLAFPQLAEATRPLMPLAVFVFTFGAFLKVDLQTFRATVRDRRWVGAGLVWSTLGVPALMAIVVAMVKPDADTALGMMLCALAPPVGSAAAIAAMLGLDTAFALLASIVATVVSPFLLPPIAALWSGADIAIDPATMMLRLAVIVGGACLAASLMRRFAAGFVNANPHAMTGVSVLGLILVAVGAMSGMQAHFLAHPFDVATVLALAFGVNIGFHIAGLLLFLWAGQRRAMTLGLVCGNRNVTLAWAAAGTMLAGHTQLELYLAMSVLPIFLLPACWQWTLRRLDRYLARRLARRTAAGAASSPALATVLLLAAFPALSPLSIDLGQPAMPLVAAALDASPGHIGLTLSLFMAGFAIAQLVAGPVSDRAGRKPPLVAGSALYALAGLGCAVAPNITLLIAMRLLQGLGAGTCVVITFAVIRDRYEGSVARVCLSSINAVMWTAPIIAPGLGVGLLTLGGWRLVYATLAASGVLLIALSARGFTESLRTPDRTALEFGRIAGNYRTVLGHRSGAGHAALVGLSFGGMFAYVAGASPAFQGYLGMSPPAFAGTFAAIASGLTTGSLVCARLAARGLGSRHVTGFGVAGLLVSSAALLGICLAGMFTAGLAVPLLFLNAAATGLAMPGAVQGAMQPFPLMAGTASAVQGCFRMFGAAVSSALVAALTDGTPVAMALVMTVFASAGGLVWWGTTMKFGWRMPIAAPTEPKVE